METVEEALDKHIAGETDHYDTEHRMRTAEGDWKWIRDVGRIFERNEAGEPVRAVGMHIDIDERKRNEQLLQEQREMFTQGPAILFKWENADGWPVEFVSENVEETLGYKPEQFYSGELQYTDIVHDDDMQQVADETADAIESDVGYFRQKPYRLITADGESRWVLEYTKNVREDNEITHHQGYIVDVTERVSKEQQLQQQRDNLEVLNQVVRHDIRNDLQLVLAYANMLESHVAPDGSEHIEQVVKSTQDAIDITNTAKELTDIMLQKDPSLSPVQLPAVLSERLMAVRSSNEDAEINLNGSIPDVKVLADEMLESVFRNLLKNAILHNDKQTPKINVSARCTEETVAVHIADNGPGIPDSQKEMIFEEGETTLDSDGTGLGLYLVETLIDRYGGTVKLTDNDPEGSVFTVELKRA